MTDSYSQPRAGDRPRFLSVPATARILGVSAATLYRSIAAQEFPAVRIRNRLIVPAEVVEQMRDAALKDTA